MPFDRIANVVMCVVPGDDLRSQAMSSYVQQQILAGTTGFVSWQHSPPRLGARTAGLPRWPNARCGRRGTVLQPLPAPALCWASHWMPSCLTAPKARRC